MNKKNKDSKLEEKINTLNDVITEYMKSGKGLNEFVHEHVYKEYIETGDEKLKEMAIDYFLEKMD